MCHKILSDRKFFEHLARLDQEIAEQTRQQGCPHCSGPLHSARYPRKPRGVARQLLGPDYEYRHSYCCAREGCRRRVTPGSVRFLGRRVYLGVVMLLAGVLSGGVLASRVHQLRHHLGLSAPTLRRWQRWWQRDFVTSQFWLQHCARLSPPVATDHLPERLVARFDATRLGGRLLQCLHFLLPLSIAHGTH